MSLKQAGFHSEVEVINDFSHLPGNKIAYIKRGFRILSKMHDYTC